MAKQLLVIDHNLAVHRLLEFTLSKEGFHLTAVEDGLAGLDTAYQVRPDLIMVNSQPEGIPLPLFIQKVRERLPHTPIILMAQPSENLNLEQLRKTGVTDVIKKPLDAMEITATVARCVPADRPAAARGRSEGTPSQPSASSTEEDPEVAQMEQMLGWTPQDQFQKAAAPPPSTPPPPPAAAPVVAAASGGEDLSLEDMLLTGSDAMHYQPPAAPLPPPPPPPEPEPSPLDELFAAQAPIPVKANKPGAATPPPAPRASQPAAAAPSIGLARQETEALIRATVEELTRAMARETVERVTKEIVPELAERAVKDEIDRLKADSAGG
jgi:DNA-binding response OmpR family regulator